MKLSSLCVLPLWLAPLVVGGCGERPEDGLDALLVAVHERDADEAWERFDRASRRMMEDTAASLAAEGRLSLSAKDHLMTGFAPRIADRIELVERDGDTARLRIIDLDGKTEEVAMRYEDGHWRVHLEGAD